MKKILLLTILTVLAGCSGKKDISEMLKNNYEVSVISNEQSSLAVNLEANSLKEILVLLHNNYTADEIKKHFSLSDSTYNVRINELFAEGLIKKRDDGSFAPTCMVISAEEGKTIKGFTDSLSRVMSGIAIDRKGKIQEAYSKINSLKNIPFEDASLFIMSNVIHNFWQMKFIEEKFLKSLPPHRGINRYYLSIQENNSANQLEPFGLYKNYFFRSGEKTLGSYGNSKPNLVLPQTDIDEIAQNRKNKIPVLSKDDQKKLYELSSIVTQDLISYLERYRTFFEKQYLNSVYRDQTTFREWFVWVYQFIITETTNTLIKKNYIKVPAEQNKFFVLVN